EVIKEQPQVELEKQRQNAEELREAPTRRLCFKAHGQRAFFTGETDERALDAGHIIDVDLFSKAGVRKADNSPYNVIPISAYINRYQRCGMVRMESTATGLRLVVLCDDPEIMKLNGLEEEIPDPFTRERVHERVRIKNEHSDAWALFLAQKEPFTFTP
ncbi:MAG: hypothetical protein OK454_09190, partial [Thaumarchaeota archaeon]|nr:hypothetical protein [Nitrososphaerota archaeon]